MKLSITNLSQKLAKSIKVGVRVTFTDHADVKAANDAVFGDRSDIHFDFDPAKARSHKVS